jgi:hypothetical protein
MIRLNDEEIKDILKNLVKFDRLHACHSIADAQLAKLASLTPEEVREEVAEKCYYIEYPDGFRGYQWEEIGQDLFPNLRKECYEYADEILAIVNKPVDRVRLKGILEHVFAQGVGRMRNYPAGTEFPAVDFDEYIEQINQLFQGGKG